MTKPLVYLCGPINNRSADGALGWREEVERFLAPEFDVLSPLRGKDHAVANAQKTGTFGADYTASAYTTREIIDRDLLDLRKSRAVIRYYDAPSEGSPMEMFYAANVVGIPVVVVNVSGQPDSKLSVWLRHHAAKIVPDLASAAAYLKHFWLYPGETVEPKYDAHATLAARALIRDTHAKELCANCNYTFEGHLSNTGVIHPCWKPSGKRAA